MTVKRASVTVGERNDGRVGDSQRPAGRRSGGDFGPALLSDGDGGRAGGAGYPERRPGRFLRRDR